MIFYLLLEDCHPSSGFFLAPAESCSLQLQTVRPNWLGLCIDGAGGVVAVISTFYVLIPVKYYNFFYDFEKEQHYINIVIYSI